MVLMPTELAAATPVTLHKMQRRALRQTIEAMLEPSGHLASSGTRWPPQLQRALAALREGDTVTLRPSDGGAVMWLIDFVRDPRNPNRVRGWRSKQLREAKMRFKAAGYSNPYPDPEERS